MSRSRKQLGQVAKVTVLVRPLVVAAMVVTMCIVLPIAPPPAAAATVARTVIGEREGTGTSADWSEFAATAADATYTVGASSLSNVRDWIGHSTCGGCGSGTTKSQRFAFSNLTVGEQYVIAVHPAYVTGNPTYTASVTSGTATIALGSSHTFRQSGYYTRPEGWQIEFVPGSANLEIKIGNGLTTGTNYLYLDYYVVGSKSLRIPTQGLAARIGDVENFDSSAAWSEFSASASAPTHAVGSGNLSTIRGWIGHSTCPDCGSGTTKTQAFSFDSLTSGQVYWLTVYPAQVTGSATYSATIASGAATIDSGSSYTPATTGYQDPTDRWAIKFTASSSSVTLVLGNAQTATDKYMYVNWYDFSPAAISYADASPSSFGSTASGYDTYNSGDWWKGDVVNGTYRWNEGYVLDSYLNYYLGTQDLSWLQKLVSHADAVLAQRDSVTSAADCYGESAPSWKEDASNYVWVGFTGAMFAPMMDFARVVLENPNLAAQTPGWLGGATLGAKASTYVTAFQSAVDYHESEWATSGSYGWYKFQNDLSTVCGVSGAAPLAGQPVAYDMNALMMEALLGLADAYRAVGDSRAATYQARVAEYANFFKSTWTYHAVGDNYTWNLASYYTSIDDIGHANFNVKFATDMFTEGVAYSQQDMDRIANTVAGFILDDSSIPFNEIDAVYNPSRGALNDPIFYMSGVSRGKPAVLDEVARRHRLTFSRPPFVSDSIISLANFSSRDYSDQF